MPNNSCCSGQTTVNSVTFGYREEKANGGGGGTRYVAIFPSGVSNGWESYSISPNPHDNGKYNKKSGPTRFYCDAAKSLGGAYDSTATAKPRFKGPVTMTWEGVSYTLTYAS